jgi:release factor glutamine methyltransferase
MRTLFRIFWLPFYRRWALRHVRKLRAFRYEKLVLTVPPGVFHPGIYFSTPIFLRFLQREPLEGKKILDIGAGSGILALYAASRGGMVVATDVNPASVETIRVNALLNGLRVNVFESDLFDDLPAQLFDVVLINPPYYPKKAETPAEHAFFAGPEWEYFAKLFHQMPDYLHHQSQILMVLSQDCNLEKIKEFALASHFTFDTLFERSKWGERFFIIGLTHPGRSN